MRITKFVGQSKNLKKRPASSWSVFHFYFKNSLNCQNKNISAAGWAIFAFGVLQFPIFAIYEIASNSKKSLWNTLKEVTKPSDWGPNDLVKRDEWTRFKHDAKERRVKEAETAGHSYWKEKLYILLGRYKT